jgi:hypothetical protein
MIFVKILNVCVRIPQFQYSSHFVELFFFDNITITLFLKLSGIFFVFFILLIRQHKVCFVSSSSAWVTLFVCYLRHFSIHLMLFQTLNCYSWTKFLGGNIPLLFPILQFLLSHCIALQYIVFFLLILYKQGQILCIFAFFVLRLSHFIMLHHLMQWLSATLADITFDAFPGLTGLNQYPFCMNVQEFTGLAYPHPSTQLAWLQFTRGPQVGDIV